MPKIRDFAALVAFKARIHEPDEVMLLGIERALIEMLYAYGAITDAEHAAAAPEARKAVAGRAAKDGIPDRPVVWHRADEAFVRVDELTGDDDASEVARRCVQRLRNDFHVRLYWLGARHSIKGAQSDPAS